MLVILNRVSKSWAIAAVVTAVLAVSSAVCLKLSQDTLTRRMAVDESVFDQTPHRFLLDAGGGVVLNLKGPDSELALLRRMSRSEGFRPKGSNETSFDFALRAATFTQTKIPHGDPESKFFFRTWGFEKVLQEIDRGEKFWCGTYARFLAVMALSENIPARSVWMRGHVTSEIHSSELGKWIMVDANYNHFMTHKGMPLSVLEIRNVLRKGLVPTVVRINTADNLDEASIQAVTDGVVSWYLGPTFKIFDGDINFESDWPHLILPAMSLSTPGLPGGTSWLTRAMRIFFPLNLAALLLISIYGWYTWGSLMK